MEEPIRLGMGDDCEGAAAFCTSCVYQFERMFGERADEGTALPAMYPTCFAAYKALAYYKVPHWPLLHASKTHPAPPSVPHPTPQPPVPSPHSPLPTPHSPLPTPRLEWQSFPQMRGTSERQRVWPTRRSQDTPW